jgi:hypothetical protein
MYFVVTRIQNLLRLVIEVCRVVSFIRGGSMDICLFYAVLEYPIQVQSIVTGYQTRSLIMAIKIH